MLQLRQLQAVLEQTVMQWDLPGLAVGLVRGDEIVFQQALGVQSTATGTPITPDSVFCVASVSKCFVATAVMQMVERGELELDAPVVKHLPYLRLDDDRFRSITARQLLSHTSGLPDISEFESNELLAHPEYDEGAAERFVRGLVNLRLVGKPGENFSYSNIGYNILGDLLAKICRKPFEALMRERLLLPSGMPNSTFLLADVPPERLAVPHLCSPEVRPNPIYPYHRADAPASFLHSTIGDMCDWAITSLGRGSYPRERILSQDSYDTMWAPAAEWGPPYPSIYEDMALGWTLGHFKRARTISHGGMGMGWSDFLLVFPEQDGGLVVLCNGESFARDRIVRGLADALIGEAPQLEPASWAVPIRRALADGGRQAARACSEEIRRAPASAFHLEPRDLANLAFQLFSAGRADLAIGVLELNVAAFPAHTDSYMLLAELCSRQGNSASALDALEAVLRIEPDNPQAIQLKMRIGDRPTA